MISEGTDIPRLQVCCHLSRVKTELYFRQVLGRILRTNDSLNQQAWLYTFAEPKLVEFASRIAEEIPDTPVIFSEPIEIKLKQEFPEPYDMTVKTMPPTYSNIHNIGRLSINTQTPSYSIELSSRHILGTPTSLSFELLGGFREKVVSTFNSPF